MCVLFQKVEGAFHKTVKRPPLPRFQSGLLADAVLVFLSWPAGLFLSLRQPQSRERWGHISHRQASSQHGLRASPHHHHHSLTWPPPSLLLAREECVALPGMLAAAPPLGSEIRTIWWGEGRQDSAGGGGGEQRGEAALLSDSPLLAEIPGTGWGIREMSSRGKKRQGKCL